MKKHLFFLAILTLLLAAAVLPASAADKIIGEALYTDIVAYIDGHPIESYNVRGNTYIKVEDLADYGFNVYWWESSAKLSIHSSRSESPNFYKTTYQVKPVDPALLSTKRADIYETKVKTVYWDDGEETLIDACNIGGMTLIWLDDFAHLTDSVLEWVPEEKALRMTTPLASVNGKWGIIDGRVSAIFDGFMIKAGDMGDPDDPFEKAIPVQFKMQPGDIDMICMKRPEDKDWRTYDSNISHAFALGSSVDGKPETVLDFGKIIGMTNITDGICLIDETEYAATGRPAIGNLLDPYIRQYRDISVSFYEQPQGYSPYGKQTDDYYTFYLECDNYFEVLKLYESLNP